MSVAHLVLLPTFRLRSVQISVLAWRMAHRASDTTISVHQGFALRMSAGPKLAVPTKLAVKMWTVWVSMCASTTCALMVQSKMVGSVTMISIASRTNAPAPTLSPDRPMSVAHLVLLPTFRLRSVQTLAVVSLSVHCVTDTIISVRPGIALTVFVNELDTCCICIFFFELLWRLVLVLVYIYIYL